MSIGWVQIVVVVVVLVLLFGRGRISALMGDIASGIKSFRAGMDDTPESPDRLGDDKNEDHK